MVRNECNQNQVNWMVGVRSYSQVKHGAQKRWYNTLCRMLVLIGRLRIFYDMHAILPRNPIDMRRAVAIDADDSGAQKEPIVDSTNFRTIS